MTGLRPSEGITGQARTGCPLLVSASTPASQSTLPTEVGRDECPKSRPPKCRHSRVFLRPWHNPTEFTVSPCSPCYSSTTAVHEGVVRCVVGEHPAW